MSAWAYIRLKFEPLNKDKALNAASRHGANVLPEDETIVLVVATGRAAALKADLNTLPVSGKWEVTDLGSEAPASFQESALLSPERARGELRS